MVLRQAGIVCLYLFNTLRYVDGFVPRSFWEGSLTVAGLLTVLENYVAKLHQGPFKQFNSLEYKIVMPGPQAQDCLTY